MPGPNRLLAADQRYTGLAFAGTDKGSLRVSDLNTTEVNVTYTGTPPTGMQPLKCFMRVDEAWRLGSQSGDVAIGSDAVGCRKLAANAWAEIFIGSGDIKTNGFYIRTEASSGSATVEYFIIYGD